MKKKKKENPSVETVLELVLTHIRKGCSQIDPSRKLDRGVDELFKRRYTLTFQKQLDEQYSWQRDKEQVLKAARMHGVIAAAAAQFGPPKRITETVFVKAAHMMELECYSYVTAGQARRRKRNEPLFGGPWCW